MFFVSSDFLIIVTETVAKFDYIKRINKLMVCKLYFSYGSL